MYGCMGSFLCSLSNWITYSIGGKIELVNGYDLLILAAIGVWAFLVVGKMYKNRKIGGCSGCQKSCQGCQKKRPRQ